MVLALFAIHTAWGNYTVSLQTKVKLPKGVICCGLCDASCLAQCCNVAKQAEECKKTKKNCNCYDDNAKFWLWYFGYCSKLSQLARNLVLVEQKPVNNWCANNSLYPVTTSYFSILRRCANSTYWQGKRIQLKCSYRQQYLC